MAVPTELYVIYPEMLEDWKIAPAIIAEDLETLKQSLDELQKASSRTRYVFKVIRVTEAEQAYTITPESHDEEEEVDEDLITEIGNYLRSREDSPFYEK